MPARSLATFVGMIKARPDTFTFASNGSGTTSHLSGELLSILTGAKMTHVPHKGGVPATTSVATGETSMAFTTIPSALPQIRSGKVTALAVSTKTLFRAAGRAAHGIRRHGVRDRQLGMDSFAPAATPKAIVDRLHREVIQALQAPDVREVLVREGSEPFGSTPAYLAAYFSTELAKYAKLSSRSPALL